MFEKNDKRRLYQLMNMYLSDTISSKVFCDEFYYSYDLEVSDDDLTEFEQKAFSELSKISDRFSEFEEDLVKYPDTYYNEEELRKKIIETKDKLQNQSPL